MYIPFIIGILAISSCGVDTPAADDGFVDPSSRLNHENFLSCSECHGDERPQTSSHPSSGDCYSCHEFPDWSNIISR